MHTRIEPGGDGNGAASAVGGSVAAMPWIDPSTRSRRRANYASLILQFALKDFKIRYTHSVLGYTWSVINPVIFFGLYYIVATYFLMVEIPKYPAFLLLSVVMWNFFFEGSSRGVGSLLARADVLSKMVLPREVIVYSALLSAGLTFVINLAVLMVLLWATGTDVTLAAVFFPLLLLNLVALTLGVSLLLSPIYVRFHDIGYLWNIVLQVGFWMTPILYSELNVPENWRWIVWWNPVARILVDARRSLVYGLFPGWRGLVITTLYSVLILVIGALVFKRLQAKVADYL